jgi:hypothetical protein
MTSPDMVTVDQFARLYGTTVEEIQAACDVLGIPTGDGVPKNHNEDIRQVLRRWARERGGV